MKIRIAILFLSLISALNSFADKKIAVQEYNGNWLDSVPYLVEHARWGEPWAYEALAECHRYGKGGLKKSLINALFYYDLAGKRMESCMAEIEQNNHNDPIALFRRLIDYLENTDYDRVICAIDTLQKFDYHSADILAKVIADSGDVTPEELLVYAKNADTDPDASLFACVGYALCSSKDSVQIDLSWARPLIMGKIPYMYSIFGMEKYGATIKSESLDGYAGETTSQEVADRRNAVEYFLKADEYGALTPQAAQLLYHYCTSDSSSDWVKLSEENLSRIRQIAGLTE